MPAKSNFSPEVKERLRQAVLGEIKKPNIQKLGKSAVAAPAKKAIDADLPPAPIKAVTAKAASPSLPKAVAAEVSIAAKSQPKTKAKSAKSAAKKPKIVAKKKASAKKTAIKAPKAAKKATSLKKWSRPAFESATADLAEEELPIANQLGIKKSGYFVRPPVSRISSSEAADSSSVAEKTAWPASFKPAPAAKPKPGLLSLFFKIVVMAVLLLVLILAIDIIGIYRLNFNDDFSVATAKLLNLPAGTVNGQNISVSDYDENVKLLKYAIENKREGIYDYTDKQSLGDKVFVRLEANKLISDKLATYGKSVTDAQIDAQEAQLLQQVGGNKALNDILTKQYGLSLDQFRSKVMQPMLAREALQAAIVHDDSLPINISAKTRAEQILALAVASSTNFQSLAKQYTEDETGINTFGDLGWVTKGQLSSEWDDAIFSAAPGTIINHLIRSNYGYHIVKVEQHVKDSSTGVESVKLRHIMIKVDVDEYIKSLIDAAKAVKYLP